MRTVSNDVITNMGLVRDIGCRITFRNIRPVFVENTDYESSDAFTSTDTPMVYDASDYSGNVIRIVVMDVAGVHKLYYQHITPAQLDTASWPAWTYLVDIETDSKPAIFSNRLFYKHVSDGDWYYRDYSAGFGAATSFHTGGEAAAPVSTSEVYIMTQEGGVSVFYNSILRKTIGGGTVAWNGRVYNTTAQVRRFDAIRSNGIDYVYFSDADEDRTMYLRVDGSNWSQVKPVIAIDIVDANSNFTLHGVSEIDGRVVLVGGLSRFQDADNSKKMLIYSWGPENYSLGRDMFIGTEGAEDRTVTVSLVDYDADAVGGKLHLLGDKLWHLGFLAAHEAPATNLFGYDNANLKLVTQEVTNLSMGFMSNEASNLAFDLPASVYDSSIIVPGAEVTVEISYGGFWAEIGTFAIDGVPRQQDLDGEIYSVVARGQAMKRLRQWQSDSSYDYWSQSKQFANPFDMTKVVRANGDWKNTPFPMGSWGNEDVMVKGRFNEEGALQNTARAERGAFVAARFFRANNSTVDMRRGVLLNYYRAQLDDTQGFSDDDFEDNALAIIYGDEEHTGAVDGFALYKIVDGTWTKLTSWAYTIPLTVNSHSPRHWIGGIFSDGYIRVLYRQDEAFTTPAETDWVEVGTYVFEEDDDLPWKDDYRGRAGIFAENVTPYSDGPGFSSAATIIPVDDQTVFAAPTSTVVVDRERIIYDGLTPNTATPPQGMSRTIGHAFLAAPHANTYFANPQDGNGYQIWLAGLDSDTARSAYNDMVLVVEDGPGKGEVFTITDYDWSGPQQWNDTGGPYTYPEKWQDHIGDLAYGSWQAADRRRVFVLEDPTGVLGTGSVVGIYPGLEVNLRGDGSGGTGWPQWTVAVNHDAGPVSQFTASVFCVVDRMMYYSTNVDMSMEDMIRETARKAGVLDFSFAKWKSGADSFSQTGWDITNLTDFRRRKTFVTHFEISGADRFGVGYGFDDADAQGRMVMYTPSANQIEWWDWNSGTPVLLQAFPLSRTGKFTVSVYKNEDVAVWLDGELVAVFHDEAPSSGDKCGYMAYDSASFTADWPELDQRVDNFILDMGFDGLSLITQLIGEKRIYFQDEQYGGLKAFTDRVEVNLSGTAFDLAILAGRSPSDIDAFTRLRVEGAEYAERADYTEMASRGNLFGLVNARELDTFDEARDEAEFLLDDSISRSNYMTMSGAFDPRLEPNDLIWVKLPDGAPPASPSTLRYIVEQISVRMSLGDDTVLDMEVTARAE